MIGDMDFTIIGAEAVVESGGVVNTVCISSRTPVALLKEFYSFSISLQVGSYQLAVLSKISNKPFYVGSSLFRLKDDTHHLLTFY
jgi:translation initiation factor 2B subunit (eIF-2B alpha/beta/delta family)